MTERLPGFMFFKEEFFIKPCPICGKRSLENWDRGEVFGFYGGNQLKCSRCGYSVSAPKEPSLTGWTPGLVAAWNAAPRQMYLDEPPDWRLRILSLIRMAVKDAEETGEPVWPGMGDPGAFGLVMMYLDEIERAKK